MNFHLFFINLTLKAFELLFIAYFLLLKRIIKGSKHFKE
ncbi:hypothetical protein X564_20385 [Pseudoalteromonas agarivorans]|nr:hypothetical protein X564_20385 [Pseudoalteromonas agarivorans]|tara:strand:- start:9716 stop:9832 length:117 start_codon:yes stop_codon:yes gene_type:complete